MYFILFILFIPIIYLFIISFLLLILLYILFLYYIFIYYLLILFFILFIFSYSISIYFISFYFYLFLIFIFILSFGHSCAAVRARPRQHAGVREGGRGAGVQRVRPAAALRALAQERRAAQGDRVLPGEA